MTKRPKAKIEGDELVIHLPLQDFALSRSGKTFVVAKTGRPIRTDSLKVGQQVYMTATAFIYPPQEVTKIWSDKEKLREAIPNLKVAEHCELLEARIAQLEEEENGNGTEDI